MPSNAEIRENGRKLAAMPDTLAEVRRALKLCVKDMRAALRTQSTTSISAPTLRAAVAALAASK